MISSNLNQLSDDIDEDPRIVKKMMDALKMVYGKRTGGDPDRVFTREERAEIIDEAKALCGFDTSEKTDPESIDMSGETMRVLKEIDDLVRGWKETRK